jgi:hypothetical protein
LGKKRYIDQKQVFNIEDIDLNDPLHLRKCIENWENLLILSGQYLKITDLFIELENRWDNAPINSQQRDAIELYLKQGYTQKETGEKLKIGTRAVAKAVNEGIEVLASYGDMNGRTKQSA